MQKYTLLVGRILLSAIFVMSGIKKITGFAGTQQYMAAYGMPLASLFLIGAIFLELGGGLSLLLGCRARLGAIALLIFLVPTTLIFHTKFSDQVQVIMFMKNLAMMGGLLLMTSSGAGSISLDGRRTLAQVD